MRALIAFLLVCTATAVPAQETAGQALERQVVEYRNKHLRHGKVVMTFRTVVPPKREVSSWDNGVYTIEFDEGYIRRDFTAAKHDVGTLTTIVGPDETIHEHTAGDIRILDTEHVTRGFLSQVFHPNLVGATSDLFTTLHNYKLEERLGHPDRQDESVMDGVLDGIAVKHVIYRRAVGSRVEIWIGPSQGYAVLQIHVQSDQWGSRLVRTSYDQLPPGVWFPRTVTLVDKNADGLITRKEIVDVDFADFSKQPDEARFSLLTMDVPVGTVIPDTGVEKVWNGRTLETRDEAQYRATGQVQQLP